MEDFRERRGQLQLWQLWMLGVGWCRVSVVVVALTASSQPCDCRGGSGPTPG